LLEYARAKKGALHMSSAGAGSQSHLAGSLLMSLGRFESLHVPYKGGGAVPAVMTGEAHWSVNPAPSVLGLVRGGKVRALGHSLPKRTALLQDMPAIAEFVPGYVYSAWNGLLAPRGTPRPILERLRSAVAKSLQSKELLEAFSLQATEVLVLAPDEFRKLVQETMVQNQRMVKELGLTAE
jgi:tripartite-type tricarboxylate transporter receptor subunit TctC